MNKMFSLIAALVFAAVTIVAGFWYVQQQTYLNAPDFALEKIEKAIRFQDKSTFEAYVDVDKVSQSILNQILSDDDAPEKPKNGDMIGNIKKLGNALEARFTNYIKPELEKNIAEQLVDFISNGKMAEKITLSSLYSSDKPLLEKVWGEFSGGQITFSTPLETKVLSAHVAKASLDFTRPDIDHEDRILFSLTKNAANVWQITAIDNLADVLARIQKKSREKINALNVETAEKIASLVRPFNLRKSAGKSKWGIGKGIMLGIAFENLSVHDITFIEAHVTFKNAQGEILRQVIIEDTDAILAKNVSEKSWPMAINPVKPKDNALFNATDADITIDAVVTQLTLADGRSFTILPTH